MQGRQDVGDFIAGFAGDDRYIVDYLVEEVLRGQPDRVRTFLLRTCLLERLSGPLCDAVTGERGGRATLEALDRANLFVVPLDDNRTWYRYHHLFADMLVASVAAFSVGQALLSGRQLDASLSDPGALRSVVGAALYVTVAGMAALALGALLRNTAAAITTFVAVFFVIPPLTLLLPASLTDHFVAYLPSSIGAVLTGDTSAGPDSLAPWTGFGVLCGYAAVLIGLAAWRLRRADA